MEVKAIAAAPARLAKARAVACALRRAAHAAEQCALLLIMRPLLRARARAQHLSNLANSRVIGS